MHMTRLTYQAPGVYVEEIPSARQPIAGVGTNTAAFIGIVSDTIYYPVPNPYYDPVAARAALAAPGGVPAAGAGGETPEAVRDRIRAERDKLKEELTALQNTEGTPRNQIKDKQTAVATKETELENAETAVARAHAPAETEDDTAYEDGAPDADWMEPAPGQQAPREHPYYLKAFNVEVDPWDTKFCTNFTEYTNRFGPFSAFRSGTESYRPMFPGHHALTHAVNGFFKNGGTRCFVARVRSAADIPNVLKNMESIDEVALIAAPGLPKRIDVWNPLMDYAEDENHENVFAILDSPKVVGDPNNFDIQRITYTGSGEEPIPHPSKNAAFYFPQIEVVDPAKQIQDTDPALRVEAKYRGRTFVAPSGHMAGVYARTDEERGVHKAPANCVVRGAINVKYYVSKPNQEVLNPQGVNVIKTINGAVTVWGARTIGGDRNGEWKYINVRRFFLFLQESIDEGTQWVVFEPNDYALWGKIRLNVTAFLTNVWRSGALFGLTPDEAFYVKCDAELNPPEVRDLGQVITEIGVAIVRPAEFVIFRISQSTGQEKT
ncbi:MAG TPA: phage tail sheath C-terminal domain-containing protein [Nitrosospira sp.]|nr:phage tail sheath C-terminal domain-containing protein [Nitrosospira sp.]